MAVNPRAPLIAGAAQQIWRDDCPGPIEMLAEVSRAALADCSPNGISPARFDSTCVVRYVSAEHSNPARAVADALGIDPGWTIHTSIGGDTPQVAVGELSARIARGELDSALVCGGEALSSLARHLKSGTDPGWQDPAPGSTPDEILGVDRDANSAEETAAGLIAPLMIYPLFEHAVWAGEGGSANDLQLRLGRLQERFSQVASRNPHAWTPGPFEAEAIATPSPGNRLVTLPYTKLMNSNIQTDQAAALFLCSHAKADSLGIPADRRVYLHGSAKATEPWFFSTRDDLSRSPALGSAVRGAVGQAGVGFDDLALLDIYSCFPSAVRIAGRELGWDPIGDPRPPTVTGGLAFAGGPGNAYVLQSLAAMVGELRERPDEKGLVTAVGWYLTKHAAGVYAAHPPSADFREPHLTPEPPAARQVAATDWAGEATAEAATVIFERDGSPSFGIVSAIAGDGIRVLRSTTDRRVLDSIPDVPIAGERLEISADGFSLG